MDQTHASASAPKDIKQYLAEFDKLCTEYLVTKAPFSIPEEWKNLIITIMAWLNVIGIIVAIPVLLALLGLGTILAPLAAISGQGLNPLSNIGGIIAAVFTVAGLALSIMAAPGLFKREKKAWTLSFYNVLLSMVQSLISFNLGGLIIGGLIGLYVLYQLRSKFVN
ncbi:MAG: hypothetical protein U0525_05075 [Patescibacteria group bacterium]